MVLEQAVEGETDDTIDQKRPRSRSILQKMHKLWMYIRQEQVKVKEFENPESQSGHSNETSREVHAGSVQPTLEFNESTFEPFSVSEAVPKKPPDHSCDPSQEQTQENRAHAYISFPAPLFHTGGKPRALDSRSYPEYLPDRPRNPSAAHHTHARWHPNSPDVLPDRAESIYYDGQEMARSELSHGLSNARTSQSSALRSRNRGFTTGSLTPDVPPELSQRLASRPFLPGSTRHSRRRFTRSGNLPGPEIHQASVSFRAGDKDQSEDTSPQHLRGGFAKRLPLKIGDDERVPKFIWYTAGGMGPPPTGKVVKDWKHRYAAQKAKEKADVEAHIAARKENKVKAKEAKSGGGGGFWEKILSGGKWKKLTKEKKENTKAETKEDQEGTAEGEANGESGGSGSDAPKAVE